MVYYRRHLFEPPRKSGQTGISYMMASSNGNISASPALCKGNPPLTAGILSQRPVMQSFDVFFVFWAWTVSWSNNRGETPSHPLWRHCNVVNVLKCTMWMDFFLHMAYPISSKNRLLGPFWSLFEQYRYHGWPSTQPGTCTQPCPIVDTVLCEILLLSIKYNKRACRLFGAKPPLELMLTHCHWNPWTNLNEIWYKTSIWRKCIHRLLSVKRRTSLNGRPEYVDWTNNMTLLDQQVLLLPITL